MNGTPINAALTTRFAPSPTGYLHLGHLYAAYVAWQQARDSGGRYLVRVEDIDTDRCHTSFETALLEDLDWVGLGGDDKPLRQSETAPRREEALARLRDMDVLYPCFCTRKDIQRELAGLAAAPHGPEGPIYPGTCRRLDRAEAEHRQLIGEPHALRLDMARATALTGPLHWRDLRRGQRPAEPEAAGDVILARKDIATSYHLAVVVDDHDQGVTLVTRGEDLLASTDIHRLLQALLGFEAPVYLHHGLVLDAPSGQRLAKRADSVSLRALRAKGLSPQAVLDCALRAPRSDTQGDRLSAGQIKPLGGQTGS